MSKLPCFLLILTLCGCGGGGDDAEPAVPTLTAVEIGVFVDAPVMGLDYRSESRAGLTAVDGAFGYRSGEAVRFGIGDIVLGTADGKSVVLPFDLVSGADIGKPVRENPPAVTNIARLLATLDEDGDLRNGMQISAQARQMAAGVTLDFSLPVDQFAADGGPAQRYIERAAPVAVNARFVPAAMAQDALQQTADHIRRFGQPNRLPAATAPADLTVDEGATVVLQGRGQDADGLIAGYQWQQLSGTPVELRDADQTSAVFTAPQVNGLQPLRFSLVVTDDDLARSMPAVVTVNVRDLGGNRVPAADAGPDQTVSGLARVNLDGSATDTDGTIARFRWTQIEGPEVALTGADGASARFVAPQRNVDTPLVFRLDAVDDDGAVGSDQVRVLVRADETAGNEPPQASAGSDRIVIEGQEVLLDGRGSTDDDGRIAAFSWRQTGGPSVTLSGANTGVASFTAPEVSVSTRFDFSLTVADDQGASDTDSVSIFVQEEPRLSDAGAVGLLGALSSFMAGLNGVIADLGVTNVPGALESLQHALTGLLEDLTAILSGEPSVPGLIGADPVSLLLNETQVDRSVETVILTGAQLPAWSSPAAAGSPYPYPSGATISGQLFDPTPLPGQVQSAHNGVFLYPLPGTPAELMGIDTRRMAAYRWTGFVFEEIPLQVDQRYPYFLANAGSDFSVYSGTDEELSYQWDVERWNNSLPGDPVARYAGAMADPVTGLDNDDEVVFMYRDAGLQAPADARPTQDADFDTAGGLQLVTLLDPLKPDAVRFVYLGLKRAGSTGAYFDQPHYVHYLRDEDADRWIDRYAYCDEDPEKLGTSNTGYGQNRSGAVATTAACNGVGADDVRRKDGGVPDGATRTSTDRFPRDGVQVFTDTYRWRATGRWMVREINIAQSGQAGAYGADLIDRWKGRAFQQSPDSTISIVGFEDEQVNWEANSTLLGERCGPVRCIREVWGADSGTNVTKTETFYRDAVSYRYRVRVHPIPPDGLYTSWDYNRSAMVPSPEEAAGGMPAGRYFTVLRPQGVLIDGINDDVGQIDGIAPVPTPDGLQCLTPDGPQDPDISGRCPAFFDVADPTFNLPLAFNNWEQVSGKGSTGSLVYIFELKGMTSLLNPLVVPYYRDDACLDDGTGDDPVQRPFPGESYGWNNNTVPLRYEAMAGRSLDFSGQTFEDCLRRQGAHGAHGVHYFFTHDSDNAFVLGKPLDEIDGQQWQFMVPTAQPVNVGARYANVIRVPVQSVIVPLP